MIIVVLDQHFLPKGVALAKKRLNKDQLQLNSSSNNNSNISNNLDNSKDSNNKKEVRNKTLLFFLTTNYF